MAGGVGLPKMSTPKMSTPGMLTLKMSTPTFYKKCTVYLKSELDIDQNFLFVERSDRLILCVVYGMGLHKSWSRWTVSRPTLIHFKNFIFFFFLEGGGEVDILRLTSFWNASYVMVNP